MIALWNARRVREFPHALCLLVPLVVGLTAVPARTSAQEVKKYTHKFYHDFRGKPLPKELHVAGKHDPSFVTQEPQGFRVSLPNTFQHEFGGVGCRTNFKIQGDFEFTGTFEILHAEVPSKGFGVGATLRAQKREDPSQAGATLARMVRAGGEQVLIWDHTPEQGGGGRREGVQPCADKLLRLRMVRTGTTLHYLWAPGTQGDHFEELHAEEAFGDDDIIAVRMNVQTGRVRCEVDVRFLDFRIRSGGPAAVQAANVAPVAPPPNNLAAKAPDPPRDPAWLVATLLCGVGATVLLFLAVGTVLFMKRRSAAAAAVHVVAAEVAFLMFPCPACAKSLKVKASSSGKTLKCPKCGQALLVPGVALREE